MRFSVVLLGLLTAAVASGCSRAPSASQLNADNPVRPIAPPPYGMEEFFAESPRQPSAERVRLGRWLFYDERLSADRTVACATCHRPEFGFSDTEPAPVGIGGQRGRRKTPSILNLAARTDLLTPRDRDPGHTFFWDGRARSLEAQAIMPIADPGEMGLDHPAMITRLSGIAGYRPYFAGAFGSDRITIERVAEALADYVRSRRSGNAPYDRWAYGREPRAISIQAQEGSDIFSFKARCAVCHAGFNFSDSLFHNLGVGWDSKTQTFADEGRAAVTQSARDRGAFKTPGLRDVEKHPPYMHDGSLATLRDVVEFYNRGGVRNPWQSQRIVPLGLSPEEVDAVVAFLRTLNGEGYQDARPRFFPQ